MRQLQSIITYPDRGTWGDSNYRGNCSGHVILDLINHFYKGGKPMKFIEVFSGGGTGKDVAKELGLHNSVHLDLMTGWNATTDDIPFGADFVFSHPPYWDIIKYETQRKIKHEDDLSNNMSYEEFIQKLDMVNCKIYSSLVNGGRHAMLIGDIRKKGKYYSMQKDLTWFGDIEAFITKVQHNTVSDRRIYKGDFIPIVHEHLLVFKKNNVWAIPLKITRDHLTSLKNFTKITWRDLIQATLEELGGKASLTKLYENISDSRKAKNNQFWKEKIRQTLQRHPNFLRIDRGEWSLQI